MSDKKTRSIQRAIDVAVEAFTSHRLDELSINAIARQARCSTATIYEVFGSKAELFRIAAAASIERSDHPRIGQTTDLAGLRRLFDFCMARMQHLVSPERARGERMLNSHFEISGPALQGYVRDQIAYIESVVQREIVAAIELKLIRDCDVACAVHAIISGSGFTPIVLGNYQLDPDPDFPRLLRLTFNLLLTPAGRCELQDYLDQWTANGAVEGNCAAKQRLH